LRRAQVPWTAAAALLTVALAWMRAVRVDHAVGGYTACHGCFLLPVLGHDAWLVAAVFVLLALGAGFDDRRIALPFRLIAASVILVQAIDLVLLYLFTQRFYLGDLLRFSNDSAAAWSVARAQFLSANALGFDALGAVVLGVLGGLLVTGRRSRLQLRVLLAAAIAALVFSVVALSEPLRYVHEELVSNVLEVNLPQDRAAPFSTAYAQEAVHRAQTLPLTCDAGKPTGRNIVIVITESLSAWQSALLGGAHDWLPRLDALARANHYFTRFYANGFTTDGGEIAAITGRPPLIPPGSDWYSLNAFGPGANTLPGVAHRAGYTALHFTTENLGFLDTGAWLRKLGFDTVEGGENPFYAGMPREQFGAAEDAALFARFLDWLGKRRDARPFVAVLLTVSSHPPFVDPRSGRIDPAGTFHYVDDQLADFHDALAKQGFLTNGILMITGDHRSMTPIGRGEYARFGERAFARIPLIVAGAVDMPPVVDAAFQQSDIPASIAHVLGVNYCRSAFNGVFLDRQPQPAKYVVQARGDNRNRVDVYFDDRVASYLEDGDRSHWLGSERPPDADRVAAWIDAHRVRDATTLADER
jgi:phosphoglycerol transferase MdoB-like AlkP superfamily enzyme